MYLGQPQAAVYLRDFLPDHSVRCRAQPAEALSRYDATFEAGHFSVLAGGDDLEAIPPIKMGDGPGEARVAPEFKRTSVQCSARTLMTV